MNLHQRIFKDVAEGLRTKGTQSVATLSDEDLDRALYSCIAEVAAIHLGIDPEKLPDVDLERLRAGDMIRARLAPVPDDSFLDEEELDLRLEKLLEWQLMPDPWQKLLSA